MIAVWISLIVAAMLASSFISLRIISKFGEEERIIRPDPELTQLFIDEISLIPNGDRILECIQCGICSASCPVSFAMDYTPRQIWELLRSGQLKRALDSHTVWLCSSCYKCAVRCSTGIPFADVMYGIKRLGVKEKLNKKGISGPVWSNTFLGNVRRFDKITDIAVMLQFMMKKQPLRILTIIPESLKMFFKGRVSIIGIVSLFPKAFKSTYKSSDVKKMLDWIDKNVEVE
ncbi:MAG: 4Fe-4S dicluster domain-containing protein [Candidatus Heimdallarchaeaceae archaeon]|jgi:heterodisulfide reductase subunit C